MLANSVFQGKVLGPPLWNLFYLDAFLAVRLLDFTDVVFADDFNAWKRFSGFADIEGLFAECRTCQASLHRWGRANSVKFDPAKESFHVLHRKRHQGEDFRLLGVVFDCGLRMHAAIASLAREAGWRLQAILRPRRFFQEFEVVNLYKSLVLSYLESGSVAYFHAARSVLAPIDRIQRRLLRELNLAEVVALEKYKLAPLTTRRDIAMLGLLSKISWGNAPSQLQDLFPLSSTPPPQRYGSTATRSHVILQRHSQQFGERFCRTDTFQRSLFGLVGAYNLLPQDVVDVPSVSLFQAKLQKAVLKAARSNVENWQSVLSGSVIRRQVVFQQLFVQE